MCKCNIATIGHKFQVFAMRNETPGSERVGSLLMNYSVVMRDRVASPTDLAETYKPISGLFLFQASQAIERSQRPIMAE